MRCLFPKVTPMASLIVTTCPHCRAEMKAFRHTQWETLESRTDIDPEFCPGCGKPVDPDRTAWREAASSGELRSEAINVVKLVGATTLAITIVYLAVSFYFKGHTHYGVVALALLVGFALVLVWRRLSRPIKEPPLIRFELLPDASGTTTTPPPWDTVITDGIRAVVPPRREKKSRVPDANIPAPSQRKSLSLSPEEIARRVALAWLEPEVDHPIRQRVHVLSDSSTQWPPMKSADADLRLGTPVVIGRNGTRAYAMVREDGRGTLSLLQRNGIERVLRFEMKGRRRRA